MNKAPMAVVAAIVGLSCCGCQNSGSAGAKSTVSTGFAGNRDERMHAMVDDLKAKGYSEKRATQIAAKQIPAQETSYSESLSDILTGRASKEKAEQEKFQRDFSKSADRK